MIMITGGAYENKLRSAVELFSIDLSEVADGGSCTAEEALKSQCISDFQLLIKRLLESGNDTDEFVKILCSQNPDAVVIMDEIGCGIVPIDKNDRQMREAVGRAGCVIAENSQYVVRVCCGINSIIKGQDHEN